VALSGAERRLISKATRWPVAPVRPSARKACMGRWYLALAIAIAEALKPGQAWGAGGRGHTGLGALEAASSAGSTTRLARPVARSRLGPGRLRRRRGPSGAGASGRAGL